MSDHRKSDRRTTACTDISHARTFSRSPKRWVITLSRRRATFAEVRSCYSPTSPRHRSTRPRTNEVRRADTLLPSLWMTWWFLPHSPGRSPSNHTARRQAGHANSCGSRRRCPLHHKITSLRSGRESIHMLKDIDARCKRIYRKDIETQRKGI